MSDMRQAETSTPQVPRQTRGGHERTNEPTGWVGWVVFASMMMILVGTFQAIVGITAIFDEGYYLVGSRGLLVDVDYTAWGWTHLALGVIAIAAAVGLLAGQMWGRVVGIAMALVSAVVNLGFVAAYPMWSIIVIALDVVVIYAIAMHGKELKTTP